MRGRWLVGWWVVVVGDGDGVCLDVGVGLGQRGLGNVEDRSCCPPRTTLWAKCWPPKKEQHDMWLSCIWEV